MLTLLIGNLFIAGILAYPIALITFTTTSLGDTVKSGRLDIPRTGGRFIQHYTTISICMYISFVTISIIMKVIH